MDNLSPIELYNVWFKGEYEVEVIWSNYYYTITIKFVEDIELYHNVF